MRAWSRARSERAAPFDELLMQPAPARAADVTAGAERVLAWILRVANSRRERQDLGASLVDDLRVGLILSIAASTAGRLALDPWLPLVSAVHSYHA